MYKIEYYKKVLKDILKLEACGLDKKAKLLIDVIKQEPFKNPPPYEKLVGDLTLPSKKFSTSKVVR